MQKIGALWKDFLWASIWAVERRSRSNTLKVMTEERNFSPLTCITSQDFSIDTNILWPPMANNVWYGPPKHQLGRQTWYRHSLGDFRPGWPLTKLFEHGQRQICLVWAYLRSFFGHERGPYGPECVVWSTQTPTRMVAWFRHSLGDFRTGWPFTKLFKHGQRQMWYIKRF